MLNSISPIDGRYMTRTVVLQEYFSEYALIKYRIFVEIRYLLALSKLNEVPLNFEKGKVNALNAIFEDFSLEEAEKIKEIERRTNHDVKAVEYYIKDKMKELGMVEDVEFVHFALTSQDINNTALPLQIQHGLQDVLLPELHKVMMQLEVSAREWWRVAMLARTHGQPASPTTLGKELMVFVERLSHEIKTLEKIRLRAKMGGATGQFNAHVVCFPKVDWPAFADDLIEDMGLQRSQWTTQIAHYDDHAALFDALARVNNILIDLCRDIWTYISLQYFGQKTIADEVGSSAMPHKVNPIDFENAEGNLAMANAVFGFLSEKLPISRLQRDLTDSTVVRNVGVPFAHSLIAYVSILKGWGKLELNREIISRDLEDNWAIISEAIQNVLRRERYAEPYEALKRLTRGKSHISKDDLHQFIATLDVSAQVRQELLKITPHNYIGVLNAIEI